jgi:hypothetical protein
MIKFRNFTLEEKNLDVEEARFSKMGETRRFNADGSPKLPPIRQTKEIKKANFKASLTKFARDMANDNLKESEKEVELDEGKSTIPAAVKRSEDKHQVAINKAKVWMKKTGKSAEDAVKEFDLFKDDVKHLKEEHIDEIVGTTAAVAAAGLAGYAAGKAAYPKIKKFINKRNDLSYLKKLALQRAKEAEIMGFGEIIINDVDNDGLMSGYNYELIKNISLQVSIPIISLGGAGSIDDTKKAISAGASAAGAGSLFVFYDKNKAVLINYPEEE